MRFLKLSKSACLRSRRSYRSSRSRFRFSISCCSGGTFCGKSWSAATLWYLSFSSISTIIRGFSDLSGVDHLADEAAEIPDDRDTALILHTCRTDNSEEPGRVIARHVRTRDEAEIAHIGNAEFGTDRDF